MQQPHPRSDRLGNRQKLLVRGVLGALTALVDDAVGPGEPFDVLRVELGIRGPAKTAIRRLHQQTGRRDGVPCSSALDTAPGDAGHAGHVEFMQLKVGFK